MANQGKRGRLRVRTADATSRAIRGASERIVAGLERGQKVSQSLGRLGGRVRIVPAKELRKVAETGFASVSEILKAEKDLTLSFLRAAEADDRRARLRHEQRTERVKRAG